jgi:hypothetical protein
MRHHNVGRPYPQHGLSLHGDAFAQVIVPTARGCAAGWSSSTSPNKHHPQHVSTLPVYLPLGSTIAVHSAVPLPGRDVLVINDEALPA